MTARTLTAFAAGVAAGMAAVVVLLTHTGRPDPTIYTGGEA